MAGKRLLAVFALSAFQPHGAARLPGKRVEHGILQGHDTIQSP